MAASTEQAHFRRELVNARRNRFSSRPSATRAGVRVRITLQPDGSKAKGYQVSASFMRESESSSELVIYSDKADGVFVVKVPGLPGWLAQGRNKTDAMRNIEKAIRLWIDAAHEDGLPVPEPRGRLMYA